MGVEVIEGSRNGESPAWLGLTVAIPHKDTDLVHLPFCSFLYVICDLGFGPGYLGLET